MTAHSRLETRPIFMPIVGNFLKGLSVTVPLHLAEARRGTTAEHLHAALAERYAGERFVRVMPLRDPAVLAESYFDVQACNDSNRADLFVFGNETQVLLMARLDNLGKGASGAAVQSHERPPRHRRGHRPLSRCAAASAGRRRAVVIGVGVGKAEAFVDPPRRSIARLDLQIGDPRTVGHREPKQLPA